MESAIQKILLVDDNLANLRLLEVTFAEINMSVFSAKSVAAAKDILLNHHEQIDLVLTDIQMPGETGFDLVRWLKEQPFSNIPTLLITSVVPEPEQRIFGLSLGAVEYLVRSNDVRELVLRVKNVLQNFNRVKRLREKLEQSEGLALYGRISAASNHEFKNIVQIILFSQKNLEDALKLNDPIAVRNSLNICHDAVKMLGDLTKSLDATLNDIPQELRAVEVTSLMREIVNMVKPTFKNCSIDFPIQDLKIFVRASAIQLKQVVLNLILNSKNAIEEARPTGRGLIEIAFATSWEGELAITIRDNGIGLPNFEVRKDFKPFITTRQFQGGKGLGMWLCNRLIKRMGGELILQSEGPGQGATATIKLNQVTDEVLLNLIPNISNAGKNHRKSGTFTEYTAFE